MRGFAFQLFNSWHFLMAVLSALAIGTFSFTNSWFTADEEYWTALSISTDASGVLTFKNTNYGNTPEVIIVSTDATTYNHQLTVGSISALTCVISQITLAGSGACSIIVRRRR